MIKIVVDNSTSAIEGLSIEQHKALRKALSYLPGGSGAYFSGMPPRPISLVSKKGTFPTGLLSRVFAFFKEHKVAYTTEDRRIRPNPSIGTFLMHRAVTPYQDQLNAVYKACDAYRGTISMPTGTGKSITMVLLVYALQLKTLIVVPNISLKEQLTATFNEFFGEHAKNVTIENIDSPKIDQNCHYDCLIIDEAHHVAAKTYRKLNEKRWNGIFHRYFFTATPFRSIEDEQMLMESVSGKVIYNLSYAEAVESGYIVPVEAYSITVPKTQTDGYTWKEVYNDLVVSNVTRNELIGEYIDHLVKNGKSVLCLVKEIAHGDNLKVILKDKYGLDVPFIKGENTDNRIKLLEFNLRDSLALIGTTGVVGEGADTKPCEYVIVAGLGKSKPAFMQQIGRAVRTYPGKDSAKIIIFQDPSHRWCKSHYATQVKTLREEYGVAVIKL